MEDTRSASHGRKIQLNFQIINYPLAKQRLESLERSLSKNPDKAARYNTAIREYKINGWARRLTESEIKNTKGPVYYLLHHGIYQPEKRSTPLQIVLGAACQYQGISLNSFLHKGPCLIGSLLGVLLRFQEEAVAFTGDISKMFLQVLSPESNCHVHSLLWREMETTREPTTYVLRVTIGDKPPPDMASFVILKMAREHKEVAPEVSEIIERDRYVDDLIHSCPSTNDALQRTQDVEKILDTGGFRIKDWHCSSKQLQVTLNERSRPVQQQNPDSLAASNVLMTPDEQHDADQINLDGEQGVKTLGLSWNSTTDTINFQVKLSDKEFYTKRIILSNISRLFTRWASRQSSPLKQELLSKRYGKRKNLNGTTPFQKKCSWSGEICLRKSKTYENLDSSLDVFSHYRSTEPQNCMFC